MMVSRDERCRNSSSRVFAVCRVSRHPRAEVVGEEAASAERVAVNLRSVPDDLGEVGALVR